jgi:hypothetical protein
MIVVLALIVKKGIMQKEIKYAFSNMLLTKHVYPIDQTNTRQ